MDAATQQLALLLDLDARHDDLLRRLDELDQRVANVLAEYQPLSVGGSARESKGGSSQPALASADGGDYNPLSVTISGPDDPTQGQELGDGKKCE